MEYPYEFYADSSILLTNINLPDLPKEISFEGHRLFVKEEFHITLVAAKYLAQQIDPDNEAAMISQILQEFEAFTATTSLEKYELSNQLCFAQSGKQKTVILMATVPNLDRLFERLSQKFSIELPQQQTHVTLYRYPKDFIGIPVSSHEILESISRPIEVSQLSSLLEA